MSEVGCRIIQVICIPCATKAGYALPDGYVASFWTEKCDSCGQTVSVCKASDWIHTGWNTEPLGDQMRRWRPSQASINNTIRDYECFRELFGDSDYDIAK